MHSTDVYPGITAHHNGDYSGDVRLTMDSSLRGEMKPLGIDDDGAGVLDVSFPFAVMEKLVANKYRDEAISRLENMTTEGLLRRAFNA